MAPYNGRPVPRGTDTSPTADRVEEWFEEYNVVPADDGESVLVFSEYYLDENDDGEVIFDEEERAIFEDEAHLRFYDVIKIHQRLHDHGSSEQKNSRIVRFLGATAAAYRLEKPNPGRFPAEIPGVDESDAFLALCQRWAMQYLSACRFAHNAGVIIAASPDHISWLRSDFSLCVAGFVTASCKDLNVDAHWQSGGIGEICPYGISDAYRPMPPSPEKHCGQPKLDLFHWATWMYAMMNKGIPLSVHLTSGYNDLSAVGDRICDGSFDDWPILESKKLGPCLIKAWQGEYESAEKALQDVRATLQGCGRTLATEVDDEIVGFDWAAIFSVAQDESIPLHPVLRLVEDNVTGGYRGAGGA
jgi:hypothetical protein